MCAYVRTAPQVRLGRFHSSMKIMFHALRISTGVHFNSEYDLVHRSWRNQTRLLKNSFAENSRKNFAMGSPTNDDLHFGRHFLSPNCRLFWLNRSFSTATNDYTHQPLITALQFYLANLDDRLRIRIVRDIPNYLLCVRPKTSLKVCN